MFKKNKKKTKRVCRYCKKEFEKLHAHNLCQKCYFKLKSLGELEEYKSKKTKYNEIVIRDNKDYAEMLIESNDGEEFKTVLIDIEDVFRVRQYKWRHDKINNSIVSNNANIRYLTKFILNADKLNYVGFKNNNNFDCRKKNLFIYSRSDNLKCKK